MTLSALPGEFRNAVFTMLGTAEGEAFLRSYAAPRSYGLRLNTLKVGLSTAAADKLAALFALRPVPWCETGFYYEERTRPGKQAYHAAGLYYIQEPSAMSAVELLDPRPGETVLDLAAAPGGKTTQIAAKMRGEGLLISNEIHPQRARILAENVERMGIRNTIVTQAAPPELSARFPLAFDRIMLDAPCSGEGMFRKDPDAIQEWSPEAVELCAARQWDILQDAVAMLKPGGRLAYSTCTFNRRENEETIARLLESFPFLKLVAEKRIWPHVQEGEGHYVALLERELSGAAGSDGPGQAVSGSKRKGKDRGRAGKDAAAVRETAAAWQAFRDFAAEALPGLRVDGEPVLFGEALYLLPRSEGLALTPGMLSGLKIPRAGLQLGEARKGRFEPAHALAMAAAAGDAARVVTLDADAPSAAAFLHGDTLPVQDHLRGWCLVTVACGGDSFPLGWGKASGGQLKNHLPKGLRQPG
ncbi:RsmB/NOP family class I SAM-dependent RNA methyltransferase [Paenibacillus sp. alder61]|uniref:RsmB/NOP family class I SAM-dependent RNA methyltransferase n=1 Tax=Paenibacillus sp. alder61 TaxID=2862948 RepID=UPI001CD33BFD|nr:RsmB/NOP family class I SAM-dependent RNA methyltransferase [Paenibacillus sp. alder61]MCA1291568.1 RsmB/NOP family class I SAM-dependent RNA methyltransferase [Paenibacillus sp. alder61]